MFKDKLAELRKLKKLSQSDLGKQIGLSRGRIANYEAGTREPDLETIKKFAEYFDVSTDYLLGLTNNPTPYSNAVPFDTGKIKEPDYSINLEESANSTRMAKIPIYNLNTNGEEIFAESNIIGWQHVPATQMDHICFKITDDSMSGSGIFTDYIVTVKKQNTAADGQLVIFHLLNGSVLMRRVRYFNDEVLLDPDNPRYPTIRTKISEIAIIGVVTDVTFKVK